MNKLQQMVLMLAANADARGPRAVHNPQGAPPEAYAYGHRLLFEDELPLLEYIMMAKPELLLVYDAHPTDPSFFPAWRWNDGKLDTSRTYVLSLMLSPPLIVDAFNIPGKHWRPFRRSVNVVELPPREVWHAGSFDPEEDTPAPWIHFGTRDAALSRIGGKAVDDLLESIQVFPAQDEKRGDGFTFEIDGVEEYDAWYPTYESAQAAATRMVRSIVDNNDGSEHVVMTKAVLSGRFFCIDDVGTWRPQALTNYFGRNGIWGPLTCRVAHQKLLKGDEHFWKFAERLFRRFGVDGFLYFNFVEDNGSVSFCVINTEKLVQLKKENV